MKKMTQEEFFARYRYDAEDDNIGGGTFGDVYKAFDEVEDRWVAIKVSKRITISGKTFSLQDEFDATQKLDPNVNIAKYESLYTYKTPQGVFDYAIMQFYPDGNLKNLLKNKHLNETEKEDLVLQLLQGIGFLHHNKIIHRDLKPANLLVSKRTEKNGGEKYIVKIADFGLSKVAKPNEASRMSNSFGGGTIEYSSPEQLMAKTLRYNTDLWAFGVIAYEILTGKSLFSQANVGSSAESEHEVIQNILKKDIAQDLLLLPKKWQNAIASCLVKDPELRVKSADEILENLNGKRKPIDECKAPETQILKELYNEPKKLAETEVLKKKKINFSWVLVLIGIVVILTTTFIVIKPSKKIDTLSSQSEFSKIDSTKKTDSIMEPKPTTDPIWKTEFNKKFYELASVEAAMTAESALKSYKEFLISLPIEAKHERELVSKKIKELSSVKVINYKIKNILGIHRFALQWISWEKFGKANFYEKNGELYLDANQSINSDYVKLNGKVEIVGEDHFILDGTLITRVSHINNGQECVRNGTFNFKTRGRAYFRLMEMDNPCDGVTDYVDIFIN